MNVLGRYPWNPRRRAECATSVVPPFVVLAFVGVKMGWQWWYHEPLLPIGISLSIVLATVALGAILSLLVPPRQAHKPAQPTI